MTEQLKQAIIESGKQYFRSYYHTRSLVSKTKSNRERTAFPITIFCYFPMQHVDVADS